MKTITALMAFFVTLTVSQTAFGLISAPIYNPATGHNYYLVSGNTWTLAQNAGLSLGGNLA